ncbi:Putative lipase [Salmonella enterica subsp. enterica]|nr:Putative lipase [Salmonella enterica subsp. enterica]
MPGNKNISLKRAPGHTTERYTWDSDHQPNYNDILAERIQSTQNTVGPVLSLADETPLDATSGISMGWNFPLSRRVTTGAGPRRCITTVRRHQCITNMAIARRH